MNAMNHDQFQEHISLYVDHALSDKESAELFAHLASCAECRSFMNITMRMHNQIMDEGLAEVPLSLDRRVLAIPVKGTAEPKRRRWYAPVWFTRVSIPLPAAASILFLIIVGSLLASPLLVSRPSAQTEIKDPFISSLPVAVEGLTKIYK